MAGNEVEIRVTKKNDANLDQLGRDAKQAGKQIGDGLEKGFKDGEQAADKARKTIGRDLDKTAKDAGDAGEKTGRAFGTKLGEGIGTAAEGGGTAVVSELTDNIKGAGGGIAAAGVGLGGLLVAGFMQSMETRQLAGLLGAQLGATRDDAQRYGRIAGDVYSDGFGDGIDDVREAVSAVLSTGLVDMKAADEDIKRITELATTAAKVVGVSAQEVADAVRAMLKSGLVTSADEAFDLIVAGFQQGADAGHDLVDVLTKSSVNLHRFGLDGATAVGVLKQALDAGAPSADSFTGAIEELVGNASDGIPTFERLGLAGEEFAAQLAGGGPKAAMALDVLLDRIRAIKDPAEQSAVVVELFGEEATALQSAILAVDPSKAAMALKEFAGSTRKAADDVAETATPLEIAGRKLKKLSTDTLNAMAEPSGKFKDAMKVVQDAQKDTTASTEEHRQAVQDAAHAWEKEAGAIKLASKSLAEQIELQQEASGKVLDLAEAEIDYQKAVDDAAESLKENKKGLDITTEAGQENKQALLDMADAAYDQIAAMEQQGATTEDVRKFMGLARDQFVDMARKMGLSADEANKLADKLRLIPGNYVANVAVQDAGASNTIETIRGHLVNLTNRRWIASVAVTGTGMSGGGRYFAGLASGGAVGGGIPTAADGGARGSMFLAHEQGPELIQEPTGSVVIPAGMSRAMMAGWMNGGGGGRDFSEVRMTFAGNLDSLMATAWMKAQDLGLIRVQVR